MNNAIIVGIMLILVVGGLALINGNAYKSAANEIQNGKGALINGTGELPPIVDGKQDVYLKATKYGIYNPSKLRVKKDIPVRIHYSADWEAGCGRAVLFPEFKQQAYAPAEGEVLIEFTPTRTGSFPFHCSMKMFNGTIEVV
jgi:heme/copper-type cytochrome/quinol oxidase subunit 2